MILDSGLLFLGHPVYINAVNFFVNLHKFTKVLILAEF